MFLINDSIAMEPNVNHFVNSTENVGTVRQGSESCPIELTDEEDEVTPANSPEPTLISRPDQVELLQRLESLENSIQKKSKKCADFEIIDKHDASYKQFHLRLCSLDKRISNIEQCLSDFKDVFFDSKNEATPKDAVVRKNHDSSDKTTLDQMDSSKTVKKKRFQVVNETECDTSIRIVDDSIRDESNAPILNTAGREGGDVTSNASACDSTKDTDASKNWEEDCRLHDTLSGGVGEVQECSDVKLERLPMLTSVKKELPLLRDEFGRFLVFICSASRKTVGSSSVVGIAGTYLQTQLHNEYLFKKNDTLKNVKLEAEMTSALFALEMIKKLFSGQEVSGLCVLMVSSCGPLVKIMKSKTVYPAFNSCSCEPGNCQHSRNRWLSNEIVASTHSHILPKLMLCMEGVQVHWCHPKSLGDKENEIMNNYAAVVHSTLDEYLKTSQ